MGPKSSRKPVPLPPGQESLSSTSPGGVLVDGRLVDIALEVVELSNGEIAWPVAKAQGMSEQEFRRRLIREHPDYIVGLPVEERYRRKEGRKDD